MQRANESVSTATRRMSVPDSAGPEMQARSSIRDVVELSQAATGMQASAVVFSAAADMSDIALAIGNRLDRIA